ncbi:MAG TPA: Rrf2 family transcriptional regulator, partial [Methylovirgula sp.]
MIFLARRSLLALAAVADVALHARPQPVAAKALAGRLDLPPRHLETLLQSLVRANILKGVRGPRGGYELARERRRISAAEVVRAVMADSADESEETRENRFIDLIVGPIVERAGLAFLTELEGVTIDDICQSALDKKVLSDDVP